MTAITGLRLAVGCAGHSLADWGYLSSRPPGKRRQDLLITTLLGLDREVDVMLLMPLLPMITILTRVTDLSLCHPQLPRLDLGGRLCPHDGDEGPGSIAPDPHPSA